MSVIETEMTRVTRERMVLDTAPLNERVKTQRNSIFDIAERYGAYNVRMFGSVARGESHQASDVDFFGGRCSQSIAC